MTEELNTNNVVLGPGLFSWVFLKEPRLPKNPKPDDVPKYGCTLLWGKDQVEQTRTVQQHIINAVHKKWGTDKAKWPQIQNPLTDGDAHLAKFPAEKSAKMDYYKGMYFVNTSNDQQPLMVGPDNQPIIDTNQIYAGCTGYLLTNFWAYDTRNYGVTIYVQGVMKMADGDRLDGKLSQEAVQGAFQRFAVSAPAGPATDADVTSFLS